MKKDDTARVRFRRKDECLRRNRTQPTTGCTVAFHRSLRKSNTIFFTRGTADREWPTLGEISEVSPLPHVHCII